MDKITEKASGLTRKRVPIRGGNRNNAGNAGLAALNLNNARSNSNSNIGFRLALLHRRKPAGYGLPDGAGRKGGQFHLCRSCSMENINLSGRQVSPGPTWPGPFFNAGNMPKTYNGIWEQIVDWDNLYRAYTEAVKGKKYNASSLRIRQNIEEVITNTLNHLVWNTWEPAPFRSFYVYEPKKRLIHAPALRDRIVHHALVRQIEPLFEKKFIYDSYACRRGKGIQRAAARLQAFLRQARGRWGRVYVLKADISKYFPSISSGALVRILARTIRDQKVLQLCEKIINHGAENGRGLPVGALTSQLFANVYLDQLDHFAKEEMGQPYYLRYMDDWVVLGPDKQQLWKSLERLREMLFEALSLRLNPKTAVFPAAQGVDFCGYRNRATHLLPRKRNVKRAKARFKKISVKYAKGAAGKKDADAALASFTGYMKHCSGKKTTRETIKHLVLRKGERS